MIKSMLRTACLVCLLLIQAFAQDTTEVSQKKSEQYIGIQSNQLIRQLFSFGNPGPATNPYLLVFSSNSKATGSGVNIGFAYTFDQFNNGDNISLIETTINEFSFRIGFDQKKPFSEKWLFSWGIDFVAEASKNQTVTTNNFQGSNEITTINKSSGVGLGPRFTLNYSLSPRILLGTETNYYFKALKTSFETDINNASEPVREDKLKSFKVQLPVALFLIVKV